MGPDWYFAAYESAEANYEPEENDGREWDDLTDDERHELAMDEIYGRADALRDEAKYEGKA